MEQRKLNSIVAMIVISVAANLLTSTARGANSESGAKQEQGKKVQLVEWIWKVS